MFAVAAEAFKAALGGDSQVMACDEPGINLTYIESLCGLEWLISPWQLTHPSLEGPARDDGTPYNRC
jgi:hypothetical protein